MKGGPENPPLNIDEIVGAGLSSSGLGAPTDTTTTDTPGIPKPANPLAPNQPGRGFNLSVSPAEWSSQPSQEDFGQVDVRRGNYDTGMVTTSRLQLPFPALANRQIANQQRAAALEKQMADFDLYKGVGKAHDRYQTAFNKWSTGYVDGKVNELAKSFGGDRSAAISYLRSDPNGRAMLSKWSRDAEAVGAENKHWVDATIDSLAKAQAGEYYIPPDRKDKMLSHAQAIDSDGLPVAGVDAAEFVPAMRDIGGTIQETQYINKVIAPALDDALRTVTGTSIGKKRVGGKIVLTVDEKKSYDDALDRIVESDEGLVDGLFGGDKAAARAALEAYFPTSVKETIDLVAPHTPGSGSSGSGSGLGKDYEAKYNAFNLNTDHNGRMETALRAAGANVPKVANRLDQVVLSSIVSGLGRPPGPMRLASNKYIYPNAVVRDQSGTLWIVGKQAKEKDVAAVKDGKPAPGTYASDEPTVTEFNTLEDVAVRYESNKGVVEAMFPGLNEPTLRSILDEGVAGLPKRPAAAKSAPAAEKKTFKYNPATGQLE